MKIINTITTMWLDYRHSVINKRNRKRLYNFSPTLVCSNCTGGLIYHWLGLRFNSPFINLFITDEDFVKALESWEDFISYDIQEDKEIGKPYPVGISYDNIKIHFMHYTTFDEAKAKWNERRMRMGKDVNRYAFMLTNWSGDNSILERFEKLHFPNKIAFTYEETPDKLKSTFYIKGYKRQRSSRNLFNTQDITGRRFIDQFDYVSWLNAKGE